MNFHAENLLDRLRIYSGLSGISNGLAIAGSFCDEMQKHFKRWLGFAYLKQFPQSIWLNELSLS